MDISFTGFNNIKIGKKQYEQFGTYCTNSGNLLRDTKHYTELKITTLLTDNETGNDLTDFFVRAPKKFINPENPDKLDFHIKRFDVPSTKTQQTSFTLNGKDIILDSDKKLPLMTFLARFTRESSKNPNLSENQQKCMNFVNNSIFNETMNYIETRKNPKI